MRFRRLCRRCRHFLAYACGWNDWALRHSDTFLPVRGRFWRQSQVQPWDKPTRNSRQPDPAVDASPRSEEHTSELQSLMRISYAVFCLKKKNRKHTYIINIK